jgi:hypothetical protein
VPNWAMENWQKGKPTLFQALGITKGTVHYPKLQASLPGAVAAGQSGTDEPSSGKIPNPGPAAGQVYTQSQLQQLWISAGGNPSDALIASAIAMAESSGRADATDNDSNGTQDQGLWQVNSSHGLSNMFSPMANARAAIQISGNGTNWNPWTTYTSGAYQEFM